MELLNVVIKRNKLKKQEENVWVKNIKKLLKIKLKLILFIININKIMNFFCEKCNYKTNNNSHYKRHLISKKHNKINELELKEKKCNECNNIKDINNFSFRNDTKKYRNKCKECENNYNKIKNKDIYNQNRKEKYKLNKKEINEKRREIYHNILKFDINYKNKKKENQKKYYKNNIENEKIRDKKYYNNNKAKVLKRQKINYKKNKEKILVRQKIYETKKRKEDIIYKLFKNIRIRTSKYLKLNKISKNNTTKELIGISPKLLRKWIEYNCNIDNIDINNFHIDHVIPLNSFKDLNEDNILESKCNYWTNLKPMKPIDNLNKSDKIIKHIILEQELRVYIFTKNNKINKN
jgi:hypothetical protein